MKVKLCIIRGRAQLAWYRCSGSEVGPLKHEPVVHPETGGKQDQIVDGHNSPLILATRNSSCSVP